jgi:Raf kinase inhibitor-like YbhB/YbcL family protein
MSSTTQSSLTISSPAFRNGEFIPTKYSYDGANISPAFSIGDLPAGTKSLALIMEDPDASNGSFVHWIMWNIPLLKMIEENTSPGTQGVNSRKENKYTGPKSTNSIHHYHFKIYALDTLLELPELKSKKSSLEDAMKGHVLASGELVGIFKGK